MALAKHLTQYSGITFALAGERDLGYNCGAGSHPSDDLAVEHCDPGLRLHAPRCRCRRRSLLTLGARSISARVALPGAGRSVANDRWRLQARGAVGASHIALNLLVVRSIAASATTTRVAATLAAIVIVRRTSAANVGID